MERQRNPTQKVGGRLIVGWVERQWVLISYLIIFAEHNRTSLAIAWESLKVVVGFRSCVAAPSLRLAHNLHLVLGFAPASLHLTYVLHTTYI